MKYLAFLLLASCASTAPVPSVEHPRAACYLSCTDHRPMYANRQCQSGHLRGKDISINGEAVDEQNPHDSAWLTNEGSERGKYPKDDVVFGTCTMFFSGRAQNESIRWANERGEH